jgi:hypothetical protein
MCNHQHQLLMVILKTHGELMTTSSPAALIPVVPLTRHAAPADWTRAERTALARKLGKLGVGMTELSDARELLGFPRLSDASREDRAVAVQNLEAPELQRALVRVRTLRAELLEDLKAADRALVRQARELLELDRSPSEMRLGELSALCSQVRILEILAEPPRVVRTIAPAPFHFDEDLFAAAGGV